MNLIIFLIECGIELIPKNIRSHSAVKRNLSMKNYHSQLLDNALHHSAMKKLNNRSKRGRPDITHLCLLNALGSPLNQEGKLQIFMHTVNNKIFAFNPKIRIAKNFNRFKGLMAKMLIDNGIKFENDYLIAPIEKKLNEIITELADNNRSNVLILSKKGKLIASYKELYEHNSLENYILIIGGFQKSSFQEYIYGLTDNVISISKYSLNAWNVVSRSITYYEITHNII
ncbi:MAG: Ribosomal RNA small subunit methyltransferase Nep1 [Promethearchaeota archaeon]|nr:MAG: Ribosomal RNA small subunit methyltransferase Nep1 [Candidatus Lokiarchaeota archaeon]